MTPAMQCAGIPCHTLHGYTTSLMQVAEVRNTYEKFTANSERNIATRRANCMWHTSDLSIRNEIQRTVLFWACRKVRTSPLLYITVLRRDTRLGTVKTLYCTSIVTVYDRIDTSR